MRYDNINEMKNKALQLYSSGKNYTEIAQNIGCSRNYVSNLIKNEREVLEKKYSKILKVYKNPNRTKKNLTIGIELLNLIGVSKDENVDDYVKVTFDKKNKILILKKY